MRSSRTVAWTMILALTALAAAPTARAVDASRPTVGDIWAYSTNTTAAAGFNLVGELTFAVSSRGPARIVDETLEVFSVTASGRGNATGTFETPIGDFPVTGEWTLTGVEALETAGLKVVSSLLDLFVEGTIHSDPLPQSFSFRFQNTTTYTILGDTWRFPLDVGDAGAVTSRYESVEDVRIEYGLVDNRTQSRGSGNLTLSYSMLSASTMATRAGTFEVYRIREDWPDGSYEIRWYAPAAGNDARREVYNATGVRLGQADLIAYRYQALEPTRIFGLTLDQWAIVLITIATAAGATAVLALRKRRKRRRNPGHPPAP